MHKKVLNSRTLFIIILTIYLKTSEIHIYMNVYMHFTYT